MEHYDEPDHYAPELDAAPAQRPRDAKIDEAKVVLRREDAC